MKNVLKAPAGAGCYGSWGRDKEVSGGIGYYGGEWSDIGYGSH